MNASNELAAAGDGGSELQQLSADLEASAGFASLEKARQVLVFQTIQEAISAVPPRLEASFPRVVSAYTTLSEVVDAAASGELCDEHLARLETEIEAAGGVIAPGLWSQGDHSVAAFRAATFGAMRRTFRPQVVDAAIAALNARLQSLKLNDLGLVFQVIASFFSPLTPTGNNTASLQAFDGLDTDRQVLVFRTIQDAILATPPRSEASFAAVVEAFQSELTLLRRSAEGQLSDPLLAQLESSIEAAGGVLSPGIYAQGKQSIASFRAETFKALQTLLPSDVLEAALAALNVRLRDLRAASLSDLFKAVRTFFTPLLAQGWNSPTMQVFKSLDPQRQALVFRTVELAIADHPDLEPSIFSAAVKALAAERKVIQAALSGQLSLETLQQLQVAIDDCGGVMAPQLKSRGDGSIGDFIENCFLSPGRDLPLEVRDAAIAALNAKLRTTPIDCLDDVVATTRSFMQPLITALLHAPAIPPAPRGEPLPTAETTLIEASPLVPPLERELPEQPKPAATNTPSIPRATGAGAEPEASDRTQAAVVPDPTSTQVGSAPHDPQPWGSQGEDHPEAVVPATPQATASSHHAEEVVEAVSDRQQASWPAPLGSVVADIEAGYNGTVAADGSKKNDTIVLQL